MDWHSPTQSTQQYWMRSLTRHSKPKSKENTSLATKNSISTKSRQTPPPLPHRHHYPPLICTSNAPPLMHPQTSNLPKTTSQGESAMRGARLTTVHVHNKKPNSTQYLLHPFAWKSTRRRPCWIATVAKKKCRWVWSWRHGTWCHIFQVILNKRLLSFPSLQTVIRATGINKDMYYCITSIIS